MFSIPINPDIELRLMQLNNGEEIFQTVDRSRQYLGEFLPWVEDVKSPEYYNETIQSWLLQYVENKGFQSGIYYQGNFIGMIGLWPFDWKVKNTAISYWLTEEHQGKGIMTRCCEKLLEICFIEYGLNRIEIRCDPDNWRSRAIPERLGFVQEGVLREIVALPNGNRDSVVYSLLRSGYKR